MPEAYSDGGLFFVVFFGSVLFVKIVITQYDKKLAILTICSNIAQSSIVNANIEIIRLRDKKMINKIYWLWNRGTRIYRWTNTNNIQNRTYHWGASEMSFLNTCHSIVFTIFYAVCFVNIFRRSKKRGKMLVDEHERKSFFYIFFFIRFSL